MNDDKLVQSAGKLSTDISPERDLWPGISAAIQEPQRRRWTPMLVQAAAVVMLVGGSSLVTYMAMKDSNPGAMVASIASPNMIFEQASFGNRYTLGPGFQDARNTLVAELEVEMQKMSPAAREIIEINLQLIHDAIIATNNALEADPENLLLQERLLKTYKEELALLHHVSGLSRNVMMRNDI